MLQMDSSVYITAIGLAFASFLYYIYYYYVKPYSFFEKLNIPGPKPKYIFGNLLDSKYGYRHLRLNDYIKEYGKVVGLYYGQIPIIHIADPDIVHEILVKQSDQFLNRINLVPSFERPVGLMEARDEDWRNARTSLSPLFSPNKLKIMSQFANDAGSNLLCKILASIEQHNNVLDMKKLFYDAAMEMSLTSFFGIQATEKKREEFETGFSDFMKGLSRPFAAWSIALPKIFIFFSIFFARKQVLGIMKTFSILQQIVKTRRQELEQGVITRTDMLKLIIEAEHKEKITDQDTVQHCFTFLIGGYDTTASTLTYVAFLLATNPNIQEKLIEEIDQQCHDESDLTYAGIQKLTYMDMVVNETLRYFSPGYVNLREAKNDCIIQGIRFPKGVGVAIAVKAIHDDPAIWQNPEKFDPERFSSEAKANRHPCYFLPFSDGPRKCIGLRLGIMNMKLILTRLLQRVKFEVAKETEIPLPTVVQFTVAPENPVNLKVVHRIK